MDRIALRRRGHPDLVFDGSLVARARQPVIAAGSDVELAIYRSRTGKFILASSVCAEGHGDEGLCKALSFASADDVCLFLSHEGAFANLNESLLKRAAMSDAEFRASKRPVPAA